MEATIRALHVLKCMVAGNTLRHVVKNKAELADHVFGAHQVRRREVCTGLWSA
jgi:hypothetical protein